jgi:hypothetical protein
VFVTHVVIWHEEAPSEDDIDSVLLEGCLGLEGEDWRIGQFVARGRMAIARLDRF